MQGRDVEAQEGRGFAQGHTVSSVRGCPDYLPLKDPGDFMLSSGMASMNTEYLLFTTVLQMTRASFGTMVPVSPALPT
jgi:hypothetical protein